MQIPPKYNHVLSEKLAQEKWVHEKTYSTHNHHGPLYSIDTPPPTVSGSLHIGHIFSYTQTDFIARYKRMSGYSVYYPFGFDDNGLPTERFVEKKRTISSLTMSRSEFIQICLEETAEVERDFQSLWQRMGLSVDWLQQYSTIGNLARKISQKSFIELFKKGFIYRTHEPALYCTTCRTSVAQAELDTLQKPSVFYEIAFTQENTDSIIKIATTRPELLPSCVALLYHPLDDRYKHLNQTRAHVPLFNSTVPVIADEKVIMDKGTGLVMCCTFGDTTDIEWFKKHSLPYRQSIGLDGKFIATTGMLAGKKVPEAREEIIECLNNQELLITQHAITHTVHIHERCKKEIEYLMLPQWFLKILPYKQELLALGEKISWYPDFMKTRYRNWVENLNWDWCLSRQRFYGIPFPVWHCQECGTFIFPDEKDLPLDPQESPYLHPCPSCHSTRITPDTDVMDTWNTSSLTPYICKALYEKNNSHTHDVPFIPMSMRPQAHDIIRTWAFYTIVKIWMHDNTIAWNDIVISGHVLSTHHEKISKSQANSPLAPEQLLTRYPADALRYWTALGHLGHDIAFSESQITIGQKLIVKLWNACRFIAEHTANLETPSYNTHSETSLLNRWILHRISDTFSNYITAFEKYEYSKALETVDRFFWDDVCDTYLELVKDQLFNQQHFSAEQTHSTRSILYHIGVRILQFYAPFLPHLTETLYGFMYARTLNIPSIHQTRFSQLQTAYSFPESIQNIQPIFFIVEQVRKLKTHAQLSLKADLASLLIVGDHKNLAIAEQQKLLIQGITRAHSVSYTTTAQSTHLEQMADGSWHAIVAIENIPSPSLSLQK
jgi:valyl-tRNA synthetase